MKNLIFFTLLFSLFLTTQPIYAQFGEPEVEERDKPRNLFDEGYKFGFGFNFALNDFGFGAGGQLRLGLNSYTEGLLTVKLAGLKDPTEQTFTDFFGYQTVPEKYRRVVSIPMYAGLKKRFFAETISDNFRVFSSLSAGPVAAFSFPYFNDLAENGFRENDVNIYNYTDPIYDIFQGWDESEEHWGVGGEFIIGIDFGEEFAKLSSVQFGYTLNYFKDGIQMLQPCEVNLGRIGQEPLNRCGIGSSDYVQVGQSGQLAPLEKAHDPRKFFGTAQISFTFGWMW